MPVMARPRRSDLRRVLGAAALVGLAAVHVAAQEEHQHAHEAGEKLGTVSFPVSCAPAARAKFQRAVALLHSFAYELADGAFSGVLAADPSCAMAHWGIAMSLFHPVWAAANPTAAPSPAELARGLAEVQKAKSPGPPTAREREYVAAAESFFADADRADHPTRAARFARSMEQVHARYPDDREAAIFHALGLLGTASPSDKTHAPERQAAEILNGVLAQMPDHPGVARTRQVGAPDVSNFAAAYALAAVPARHALERRDWAAAAALIVGPASFPWPRFGNAEAITHYARALGAARRNDLPAARESLARVVALRDGLAAKNDTYWAGQVDVLRREAAAWIARAENRNEDAVRLLREAAEAEDATDKSPVTPGSILPAHEMLADMLLETGDAARAAVEYDASLRTAPGR